jgi:hypothetical protein
MIRKIERMVQERDTETETETEKERQIQRHNKRLPNDPESFVVEYRTIS